MKLPLLVSLTAAMTAVSLQHTHAQSVNFCASTTFYGAYSGGTPFDPNGNEFYNALPLNGTNSGSFLSDGATASAVTITDSGSDNHFSTNYASLPPVYNAFNLVQGQDIGTITLNHVTPGVYNLYILSANAGYESQGGIFSLNGNVQTVMNTPNMSGFIQNQDYTEFTGISPDANGLISFSYASVLGTGGSLEGDVNAVSLVSTVPEPATWIGSAGFVLISVLGFVHRACPAHRKPLFDRHIDPYVA